MPLKYFQCPDGNKIEVKECLEKCPRSEGRCLRIAPLYAIAKARIWTGKPSTTQLLNPTRMEYLKILKGYAVYPKSRAFALLGTRHHYMLEQVGKQIEGIEVEKFLDGDTTGILDCLEPDELNDGCWIITDYKTWGSFAVAKYLGISDLNGDYDRYQTELQLNNYRLKAEALGFKVSRLLIQGTVRDGNTKSAYINKIEDTMPILPVKILTDNDVKQYFAEKREALLSHLESQTLPPLCPYDERWQGRRCKGNLCEVHSFCPEGAKINRVKLEEN